MKILPTDIISGAQYLRFIDAYKKYDSNQKRKIKSQEKRIMFLEWQVYALQNDIEESHGLSHNKLLKKLKSQRLGMLDQRMALAKLREEIESLKAKNEQLEKEIERLKAEGKEPMSLQMSL